MLWISSSCWCVLGFSASNALCIAPSFISYQAITARDSMAKSLYSALFDWIVLRINHALLNKKDMEESVPVRNTHIRKCKDMKSPVRSPPFVHLAFWLFSSAYPSVSWTFLASRTLRQTASSSFASTMQTSSCSITSTITSSIWSR